MIIGIDGTCLQGVRTGAGWYLTHLLEALSHVLEEDRVYVWMNNPTAEERARVSENRFVAVNATHYPSAALKLTWSTLGTPAIDSLVGRPANVYFYPTPSLVPQKQGKKVLFIHDLTYVTNPEWASPEVSKLEKQEENADLLVTCSEYNRREMARYFHGVSDAKVRVVPHGLPDRFRKPASAEVVRQVRERHRLQRPYFLSVGTLEPRKNLLRLVHAFLVFKQRVKGDHQLVLVGPKGWVANEFIAFIQAPQVSDKVRWLDYVPLEDLPALYTGAEAFVFPSLKEGFGMPLLEAMGCGAPVVCSNTAAIPEVVGDGAWMVNPLQVGEWARALERIVSEPAFTGLLRDKARARASLFKMENTAKQTLAILKTAAVGNG